MALKGGNPTLQGTPGSNLINFKFPMKQLIFLKKCVEFSENQKIGFQIRTDIYWYAVNPTTKKICKKQDIRKLFETSNVQLIAGKVQPWFRLERISEDVSLVFHNCVRNQFVTGWRRRKYVEWRDSVNQLEDIQHSFDHPRCHRCSRSYNWNLCNLCFLESIQDSATECIQLLPLIPSKVGSNLSSNNGNGSANRV